MFSWFPKTLEKKEKTVSLKAMDLKGFLRGGLLFVILAGISACGGGEGADSMERWLSADLRKRLETERVAGAEGGQSRTTYVLAKVKDRAGLEEALAADGFREYGPGDVQSVLQMARHRFGAELKGEAPGYRLFVKEDPRSFASILLSKDGSRALISFFP